MDKTVQVGQVWRTAPDTTAIPRTFTIDRLCADEDCSSTDGLPRYAWCTPISAGGQASAAESLASFCAPLEDFPPNGKRFVFASDPLKEHR